jgi:hypothetical protein
MLSNILRLPRLRTKFAIYTSLIVLAFTPIVSAAEDAVNGSGGDAHGAVMTLLWLAVILIAAKLASLIENYGQSAVLGELIIGIVLGNLALLGIHIFNPIFVQLGRPFKSF